MSADPSTEGGPLVVACLRITDLRPEVDPLTGVASSDPWGIGLSAADAAALEHALRIADAWSGRVLAVAVGTPTIDRVLRDAVALGASALRIASDLPGSEHDHSAELAADEQGLARVIAAALDPMGSPALVLCGDRSADQGTGALPAFLAHELGAAQALGLVALDIAAPGQDDGRTLIGERRLDGGWRERLTVTAPAVCSVEGAGVRLRRASLQGTLAAEATDIAVDRASFASRAGSSGLAPVRVGATRAFRPRTRVEPGPDSSDPRLRLLALTGALVAHDPPTIVGPVGPVEAADELLGFLARHGYLDPSSPDHPISRGDG